MGELCEKETYLACSFDMMRSGTFLILLDCDRLTGRLSYSILAAWMIPASAQSQ